MNLRELLVSRKLAGGNGGNSGGGGGGESGEASALAGLIERTSTEISDSTATSVGEQAFYQHKTLKSVSLPNVTTVGSNAFYYCRDLTSVNLPKTTQTYSMAFSSCVKLTSVNLPKLETSFGKLFESCTSLTSISLPCFKKMGNNDFNYCPKLAEVNLPVVENIGGGAFNQCAFTKIDLPKVSSIASTGFAYAPNLTALILRKETLCTLVNKDAFTNTPFASGGTGGKLVVPRALTTEYPNGTNWSSVMANNTNNRILALEDYTVDGTLTGAIDWDKLNAA